MTAERLRAAATLLRERSEAATPGPWKSWGMDLLSDPVGNSNVDEGIPVVRGLMPEGQRPRAWNIDYIAMMSPPVALALAEYLTVEAIGIESGNWRPTVEPALTVADAILGGDRA